MTKSRFEEDSFGKIEVSADKLWGAQTERSLRNFKIGSEIFPTSFIHAFALQKKACTLANSAIGNLDSKISQAIIKACDEIIQGQWDEHFPLRIWQTGSGTQTNMNLNEVISNRANEILGSQRGTKSPVHPNDHVNKGQSSNDSFPTVMHIATVIDAKNKFIPALKQLQKNLDKKSKQFWNHLKIGRTHLQDAVPMRVGQEFSAFSQQIKNCIGIVETAIKPLLFLAQGGTAVGTGLNCPEGFINHFLNALLKETGISFKTAPNKFEALATQDALVNFSGVLNTTAVALLKIANDIRLLGSGPRCGINELHLPENEPGSSIMPGKVNPTQAEALSMVCCQIIGNHVAITTAGLQGHLQLNVFKPVIIFNVLQSIDLLSDAMLSFSLNCIQNVKVNDAQLKKNLEQSLMLVTALAPHIGYDKSSKIAQKAFKEGIGLKEAGIKLGYLTENTFDEYVKIKKML